jgi:hypothetical protein
VKRWPLPYEALLAPNKLAFRLFETAFGPKKRCLPVNNAR